MNLHRTAGLPALILVCMASAAAAATWLESPEAPASPYAMQWTVGNGPLTAIQGYIFSTADRDAYCIEITDRFAFTASLPCAVISEYDLWLFQTDGIGVTHNDGCSGGNVQLTGANVGGNGKYVLVISDNEHTARSAGSLPIWLQPAQGGERAPDGPGAAGAFVDWEYAPELFGGPPLYQINLTGCAPCEAAVAGEQSAWGLIKRSYR
ncbi:MAG: hypothetical protein IPH09_10155 [bacterium]|nr:hypothetical protein [bacterium]MBK7703932.1 hypothetical protein [bacterium]